ncbi:MAG TPA: hypothetical protein VIB39_10255 [Candidatus Angelobacter sp.]
MAANQGKHSLSRAQGSRHRAPASTKPAAKTKSHNRTTRSPVPPRLPYKGSRREKTAIRLRPGRRFYRFKDARGKPLEFIEFFTSSDYHCIDVRFQDKTAFHFIIDPAFTMEADYSDWKTGNWRPIKRWSRIPSENFA